MIIFSIQIVAVYDKILKANLNEKNYPFTYIHMSSLCDFGKLQNPLATNIPSLSGFEKQLYISLVRDDIFLACCLSKCFRVPAGRHV